MERSSWEFFAADGHHHRRLLRARLDQMIDLRHPLAVLATRMPWDEIEKSLAPAFAHKNRAGRVVEGADLFGTTLQLAGGGVSNRGRPRLPIRLMVALLYLKHAFNVSDEELVERWSENVVWQFFSGMQYYTPSCRAMPRKSGASGACWARPAWSSC